MLSEPFFDAIPRHGRVAIGGISMGGYAAMLLGAEGHFCPELAGALVQRRRQRGQRIRRRG
jgi:predicted dienelactone hydrolase